MPAYVIADVAWSDPSQIQEYSRLAGPTLAAVGAKILAVSGQTEVLEGDWKPGLLVLIEFPSAEAAKTWEELAEYRPARELRTRAAKTSMVLMPEPQ